MTTERSRGLRSKPSVGVTPSSPTPDDKCVKPCGNKAHPPLPGRAARVPEPCPGRQGGRAPPQSPPRHTRQVRGRHLPGPSRNDVNYIRQVGSGSQPGRWRTRATTLNRRVPAVGLAPPHRRGRRTTAARAGGREVAGHGRGGCGQPDKRVAATWTFPSAATSTYGWTPSRKSLEQGAYGDRHATTERQASA
jgi:hypothetical protein